MSKLLIQAQNLYKSYGLTFAVNGLSFELQQGDVLGFLGPNGAGKSTTMQMLAGVLPPSSGKILIDGIDLQQKAATAKQKIGYLPEIPPLYPELTVNEYLSYCGRLRKLAKNQLPQAVKQAKQRCGLSPQGQRLIGHLSKGFQQRVGIAQAIVHQPDVVILDEPTIGLDPNQIIEIRKLIAELGEHHAVILSTHILPEVQAVCNKVQIINQGQLVYSSSIHALTQGAGEGCLIVVFKQPPEISRLTAENFIRDCTAISDHRFRIHVDDIESAAQKIATLAVNQQWGLLELIAESTALEQVFVKLTSGENLSGDQAA
ncbi:MAG: ABC transporter ATP-binding protein [Gammaproteobacteria bacterium]|nr:ABC transporter ATP-binding protein [Gammaproteobacteria bacterium]